jgi:hypothetical protein
MAYETGTSFGKIQVTSLNFEAALSVSGNSSNQTLLASKIKPPIEPSREAEILAFFVLLLILSVVAIIICAQVSVLIGVIFGCFSVLGLVGFYIWQSKQMNQKIEQYQAAFSKWLKSWVCLRCGASWKV